MATRMYLQSSNAAAVSPAFSVNWETTTSGLRRVTHSTAASTALTTLAISIPFAGASDEQLFYQFVSQPINGDTTISGTWSFIVKCNDPSGNCYIARRLYVVTNDGSTVRGTLVAYATNATLMPTALQTLIWANAAAVTSVSALNGDRIVLEIGARNSDGGVNRTGDIRSGDAGGSDFALTNALTTDLNPWFELSTNVAFSAEGGGAVATNNRLMMIGVGA